MKKKLNYFMILLLPIFLYGCNLGAAWNAGW